MSAKYLWVALFVVFGCLSSLRAQPSDNFYVDPAAPSGGDGSSWATAFQTISEAVTDERDLRRRSNLAGPRHPSAHRTHVGHSPLHCRSPTGDRHH